MHNLKQPTHYSHLKFRLGIHDSTVTGRILYMRAVELKKYLVAPPLANERCLL
jgi:hypothetical protein